MPVLARTLPSRPKQAVRSAERRGSLIVPSDRFAGLGRDARLPIDAGAPLTSRNSFLGLSAVDSSVATEMSAASDVDERVLGGRLEVRVAVPFDRCFPALCLTHDSGLSRRQV